MNNKSIYRPFLDEIELKIARHELTVHQLYQIMLEKLDVIEKRANRDDGVYYGCESCSFKSFDKETTERHIFGCSVNPSNKGCATCSNLNDQCGKGHYAKLEITGIKCPDWDLNKKIPPAVYVRD